MLKLRKWRRDLFIAQDGKCFYCSCRLLRRGIKMTEHKKLTPEIYAQPFTEDHVMPRSKGGADSQTNIVFSCWPCNKDKRSREPTADELKRFTAVRKKMGWKEPRWITKKTRHEIQA